MSITQETRREGLDYIAPKSGAIANAVYSYLSECPAGATANEIHSARHEISLNSVRSRLTELQDKGLVEAFGKKVNPGTGVRVAIWRVAESDRLPFHNEDQHDR